MLKVAKNPRLSCSFGKETKCQTVLMALEPQDVLTEGQQNRRHECELLLGVAFGLLYVLIRDECNINEKATEG